MGLGEPVKRIVGIVLASVFVLGAVAFFLVQSAEEKVTADMLARAGRFAIPSEWKLTDEIVRSERFLCMSTNPCPSLSRQWDAGKELATDDVAAVVSGVGFEMKTDTPCQRPANVSGSITICRFSGTDDNYTYMLNVASPGLNEPQIVTMIVRPVD
ncbi:hypothetical protein A6A22_09385 [Arthrobacter sp. OY3WO11]|nr:hypothetical protein A6A22_09385 [Arthrobacter sp. OY3WO11]